MTHIRKPDQWNGYRWQAYVADRHGAETVSRDFATKDEALAQADAWNAEMDRTGVRHLATYQLDDRGRMWKMADVAPENQVKTYATEREAQEATDRLNHNLTRSSAVYGKYEVRLDGTSFAVRWRNVNI